jgi:hypothetical protein
MNILFLSHVPASNAYTAGLVLKRFAIELKATHKLSFVCVHPESIKNLELAPELSSFPYVSLSQPKEYGCSPRKLWKLRKLITCALNILSRLKLQKSVTPKIARILGEQKIDAVFVLMESMSSIEIVKKLSKQKKLKVFTLCTDHISWYLNDIGVDKLSKNRTIKNYNHLISRSTKAIVPSQEMKEMFLEMLAVESEVISNVVESQPCTIKEKKETPEIKIGFAGQVYAKDAWSAFVGGLDSLDWKINGKKVSIYFFGRELPRATGKLNIRHLGFRSEQEVFETLRKMDYLYCPYPFDIKLRHVYKYSFPSKLAGYYSTGVPVIAHSPIDSSIANYSIKNNSSLVLSTIDFENVKNFLRDLDNITSKNYKELSVNSLESIERDFSKESFKLKIQSVFH